MESEAVTLESGQASPQFKRLAGRSGRELERLFLAAETPSIAELVGFEYRGYNHPRPASALGIRKFIKAFFVNAEGETQGCNTPVRQNGLHADWRALPDDTRPRRFGYFRVAAVTPEGPDQAYPHAILLDYGNAGVAQRGVATRLRDYLVRAEPGADDLLLGKAYLALGPARLALGFFLLERHRRVPEGSVPATAIVGDRS